MLSNDSYKFTLTLYNDTFLVYSNRYDHRISNKFEN